MSERGILRSAVVAALALLATSAGRAEVPPRLADPAAVLSRAERIRESWPEAVLSIRVTQSKPGGAAFTGRFDVLVKGADRALVRFAEPGEEGKLLLTVGDDAWLFLPKTKNAIRVPRSHRLKGGFGAADISRTRFSEDYDTFAEGQASLDGRDCDVLRLMARAGRRPSYPVVRVWIDRKEGLLRRAVFLVASGKTAKETTFDSYRAFAGVLSIEKMTVKDTLVSGTTTVEYLDYRKASLPDALFDPASARDAGLHWGR
jgi:outer membrane lipoprotein-sorting protein